MRRKVGAKKTAGFARECSGNCVVDNSFVGQNLLHLSHM